jgi:drug/metabolite transporter (DMT)-like permease
VPTSLVPGPAAPTRSTAGRTTAIVSLLGATLFWAGNYVVGAHAVESLDPVSLVLLRWTIAAGPLLLIAHLVERPDWRAVLRAWPWVLGSSALGLLGYNLLLYTALQHTDAFSASLINAFNPALITLAAAVVLRERLTPLAVAGVGIALVGVLVVLSKGDLASLTTGGFGAGEALMVGAIVAWTGYTVLARRGPALPPVTSSAAQAVVAAVVMAVVAACSGGVTLPSGGPTIAATLYIAIFPSVLSYLLWNRALIVVPAAGAGVFLNLITVFTAILTIALGQPWTGAQLLGGAVVIGGVVVTNWRALARRG